MNIPKIILQIKSSNIGYRIANGAIWSLIGTALSKALVLISSIICAHILTKAEYGEFGMVRSTINMFVVFGSAGLGAAATKYIAEYRTTTPHKVSSIYLLTNSFAFITGALVTCIIIIFASQIAQFILGTPEIKSSLQIGGLILFVTVINSAQSGTLLGFESFKSIALNNFAGSVCESIFMLLGAYYFGVFGALAGYGTGYLVLYILNQMSIKRSLNSNGIKVTRKDILISDIPILYKYCLPSMLCSLMGAPTYWIIKTILVRNSGFDELAVYEAADQWRLIILFVPSAVSQVILPILSSITSDRGTFKKTLKYNLLLNISISFITSMFIVLFSSFIMDFYGEQYSGQYLVLILLAISTIFSSAASVVGLAIASQAKMWHGFAFNFIWAIIIISSSYIFVSKGFGAVGIALSLNIAYFIHTILQSLYIKIFLTKNNAL